jgi:hypothetical protein
MGILDTISRPAERPVIATIFGDSGMGKTTLAATFPKPIVIRAEDGLQAIPVNVRPSAFPVLQTADELWEQLKGLIHEDHEFQTLVVDSVTALERLFVQSVIDNDVKNPRSIQQALGGYGAGREAVYIMHARLRKAAGVLADRRGMHTVFIAHATTERIEPPDIDAHTRWTLRVHDKSMPAYVDDVDLVGFMSLETFVTGEGDRKKALSDGTRILTCHATPANVSKNRYGITEPLSVEANVNPFIGLVPALTPKKEKSK